MDSKTNSVKNKDKKPSYNSLQSKEIAKKGCKHKAVGNKDLNYN